MSDTITTDAGITEPFIGNAENDIVQRRTWTGLGTTFETPISPSEAFQRGGLNFVASTQPIFLADRTRVPDRLAVARDDGRILGTVGNRYEIVQNSDLCAFLERLLGATNGVVEAVGGKGNGETVWALCRLPEADEILPSDPVSRYLLVSSTFDGSGSVRAAFVPLRVRCTNLLVAAFKRSELSVSVKHTKRVRDALVASEVILDRSKTYFSRARDFFRSLTSRPMTPADVRRFTEELLPSKSVDENGSVIASPQTETARKTIETLATGQGLVGFDAGVPMSAWTLWNSVTQYVDALRPIRSGNRLESSLLNEGSGAALRARAVELLSRPTLG